MTTEAIAPVPRSPGRPTVCTPELADNISTLLARGNPIVTSCNICGVSNDSYARWMALGKADKDKGITSVYAYFADAVKRAEAQAQQWVIEKMQAAASQDNPNNWLPAAWLGERRWPELFGRRDRTTIERNSQANIRIEYVITDGRQPSQSVIDVPAREILPEPSTTEATE